jgi:hypothetical protein
MIWNEPILGWIEQLGSQFQQQDMDPLCPDIIAHGKAKHKRFVVGRKPSLQQDMKTIMPMQIDATWQGETAIWILQQPDQKGDLIRGIPAQLIQSLSQGQSRSHL